MPTLAITLTENGLIRIKGGDAEKFLQGQITSDMAELSPTKAIPGAFCSPQGRIRVNFIIFQVNSNDFLLILPKQQISFLIEAMTLYIAFFKCTMVDNSDDWHLFGLLNNQIDDESIINDLPALAVKAWEVTSSEALHSIRLPGEAARWFCLSKLDTDNFFPQATKLENREWLKQDILSGLVWISESNRDKFLPHDVSLPDFGAVSFTKGCYTGQEIIARMQYRGKPKYLLVILTTEPTVEDIPEKLVQLTDNSEKIKIGTMITKVHLTDNSWLILASAKRMLLNLQKFQLSLNETAILCNIKLPEYLQGD